MAKTKKIREEVPKKFTKEEVQSALEIVHSEYFTQVLALLSYTDQLELNYNKVPVVTPDGGTYLVSILHVDGPKINIQKFKEIAEASQKEKA